MTTNLKQKEKNKPSHSRLLIRHYRLAIGVAKIRYKLKD